MAGGIESIVSKSCIRAQGNIPLF